MKHILISIFVLATLSGCANNDCTRWPSLPIKVKAFKERDFKAIAFLNKGKMQKLFVASEDPDAIEILPAPDEDMDAHDSDAGPGQVMGLAYHECAGDTISHAKIHIRESVYNMNEGFFRTLIAHELLHAAGFFRHTQEGGLMDPNASEGFALGWGDNDSYEDLITESLVKWLDETYPEVTAACDAVWGPGSCEGGKLKN